MMNERSRKSLWLSQALVLSVILNAVLAGLFFYFIFRENPLRLSLLFTPSQEIVEKNPFHEDLFVKLKTLPYEKLVPLLEDERPLEKGYQIRDLALGMLVKQHRVDLNRALGRKEFDRQIFPFESDALTLYPSLKSRDFDRICDFIQSEKWPYTAQGLFEQIKKTKISNCDPSLLQTFCQSMEFITVEMLFERGGIPIRKGDLLALIVEGNWEHLNRYFQNQQMSSDFSPIRRREFLRSYLSVDSKTAAYLLLMKDVPFVLETFSDKELTHFLGLLTVKTPESTAFIKAVSSIRSEVLQKKENGEVVGRFVPRPGIGELRPVFREPTPKAPTPQTHVIKDGESLWIIAKKYHVSIDELIKFNKLQSTVIRPGQTLKVPIS